MFFYQVSSDWLYSPVLNRIENKYGLAGIGFYWKVVSKISLMDGCAPLIFLMALRGRGLRWCDATSIINDFGLFAKNEEGFVIMLDKCPQNGLRKQLCSKHTRSGASGAGTSDVGADVGAGADATGADATDAGATGAGSAQVIVDSLKEKIREEIEAEQSFEKFLQNQCPHLLLMQEPITFEQLKMLRKDYSIAEIRSVLVDMENKVDVEIIYRSCYSTCLSWLKKRKNNNNG